MADKKTIYIADDGENIRDVKKAFLDNNRFDVTAFETGDALLVKFKSMPCDLVVQSLEVSDEI